MSNHNTDVLGSPSDGLRFNYSAYSG